MFRYLNLRLASDPPPPHPVCQASTSLVICTLKLEELKTL